MNNVRLITDLSVERTNKDGSKGPYSQSVGRIIDTGPVRQTSDKDFVDIELPDGSILYGINKSLIEMINGNIEEYTEPVVTKKNSKKTKVSEEQEPLNTEKAETSGQNDS